LTGILAEGAADSYQDKGNHPNGCNSLRHTYSQEPPIAYSSCRAAISLSVRSTPGAAGLSLGLLQALVLVEESKGRVAR
jgi:hypothetical protein